MPKYSLIADYNRISQFIANVNIEKRAVHISVHMYKMSNDYAEK